jgi:hypothetical protein
VGFTYVRNSHAPFLSVREYILIRILRYVYQTQNTDESDGQQCQKKSKKSQTFIHAFMSALLLTWHAFFWLTGVLVAFVIFQLI